ncbi:DUF1858 domain-containing protein [Antarcticimicrobium luteum]|uniref:DUF1858 domain-containing protein n=1 Tax=Antarcticimicrobium luteum TaxID=2547397 RepID=A0A4R5UTD9_9RHOB|nr:DUF1858 domain-containing protein [Antarcticimicrobium luteum]TDK42402.1 hypothetical protein E1832_19925 [Antarcticimicrobium luteum]
MKRPDIDNPDLPLADLFFHWPRVSLVFLDRGMLCPGCPIAPFHTVIEACEEYGLDEMAFRAEIRRGASDEA